MVAGRCQTHKTSSITSFSSASKCLSCQRIKECSSRLQGVHHVYITGSVPTIMHPSIEEHHSPQPLNPLHPQLEHQATSIPLPRSPTSSRPHLSKNPKTQETMSAPTPHPQNTPQLTPPPFPRCTWTTQLLTTRNGHTTTKITVMVDCGKAYCFTSARFDRFQQQRHQGQQQRTSSSRHSSSSSSGSRAQPSDGSSSRSSSSRRRAQGGWKPWGV